MSYRGAHLANDDDASASEERAARRSPDTFRVRRRPRRRHRWVVWLLGLVVLAIVVAGIGAVWVQHKINPGKPGAAVAVTIPRDSSIASIGSILGKAGVIQDATVFRLYVKFNGSTTLLPGTYHLARNSGYDAVISALEKGPPIVYQKFTIPEGFVLSQIAARVGTLPGHTAAGFMAAATSGQVRSRYEPAGSNNLEGLLFPATYTVQAGDSDASIVQKMVTTFEQSASTIGLDQAAATLGMTPYQLVVVASMVEREAKLDEDRGPIASVIYNRLHANMLLQIDATLLYGEGTIDKTSASPYNTYKFKGLPPTPISSPGIPSLTAAANPPTTNFLYYVLIDPNGKSGFAATSSEFNKLLAEARSKGLI